MPFNNLGNRHFDDTDKENVNNALVSLESALVDKLAVLSPEERQKFGSVNEQNKLIINKVKEYNDSQPSLSSPDIEWGEFNKDHDTRIFLQKTILRMLGLINGLENAKILHDYDNYSAALMDYDYAKYKLGTQSIGFQTKVDELSQFFGGGRPPANPTPAEE
ncbi:hypothetical protein [Flavobacterium capsici]|uniref:Uncharacterized protein n=1 Tax=Flavobacterium capsici TaxID=3075618 RepID=A0AA96J5J1_9FLAO|nr:MULTISPECIES: hypothetical protein [unclassified Flavobacterium]WNM18942.1 hypothetical protein RN608_13125 [Flavobacterium sp. PMR2A8]WNM22992.1 hypothetical protein RN605_06425 [Flavobacterium sp. PMTSA4]